MRKAATSLIGIASILGIWLLFSPASLGGGSAFVIVAGASMEPTLESGDLVWVRPAREYRPGDIVAFQSGQGMVIHRIIGQTQAGYLLQGDNKEYPDPWTPTEEDVLGKQLLRLPRMGTWVNTIQSNPAILGAVAGAVSSLGIWTVNRKKRRQGAHSVDRGRRLRRTSRPVFASSRNAGLVLLVLSLVAVVLALSTSYLMFQPSQQLTVTEVPLYENVATFDYVAEMRPSVIYGSESIGPTADGSPAAPIYTQLLRRLQITVDYAADIGSPETISGSLAAALRIQAGEDGWVSELPMGEPEEFSGTGTSASFTVEWSQVSSLVEKAEEETGIVPGSYLLTALVRVGLEGEGAAAEDFVAELPMELTRTELVIPSDALKIASDATEERQTLVPNRLELIGLSLPVSRATVVAATALGVLLAWIALFSWRTLRRLGGGELARLRLRYGQLIVPVTDANAEHERTVEVASMADLVTLARKAEQMVFYASSNHGSHRFFVPDGNVVYEFWVGAHGARGST